MTLATGRRAGTPIRGRRRTPLLVVALATPLLLAATQPAEEPEELPDTGAEQVYLRDCATCHGAEGEGSARGPELIGVGAASVDYYLSTGRMPIDDPGDQVRRNEAAYSAELADALVEYVVGLGGDGPPIPELDLEGADLGTGGTLYRLQCAACHTWSGTGGALLEREAPSVLPATPTESAEAIRVGPGSMPGFGTAALNEEELNDVVAYVEFLKEPRDRGGIPLWHLGPLAEGLVVWVVGLGVLILLGMRIAKP